MNNLNDRLNEIKKIFNIGIYKSAEALSKLINKPVMINIPEIYLKSLEETFDLLGQVDEKAVSIYMRVKEGLKIGVLLLMNEDSAKKVVKYGAKVDFPEGSDYFIGVLEEICNILISYFLNTLANSLKVKILPDVPDFAIDMKGAIFDFVLAEHKNESLKVLLVITDLISDDNFKISFLIIPEDDTIEKLLIKR
ncbi:MAG: chemotaxis protein CheC [Proteobacteria bacterium]|nr:chemotaxis protein CheC [Pseudomonadota bacterium]